MKIICIFKISVVLLCHQTILQKIVLLFHGSIILNITSIILELTIFKFSSSSRNPCCRRNGVLKINLPFCLLPKTWFEICSWLPLWFTWSVETIWRFLWTITKLLWNLKRLYSFFKKLLRVGVLEKSLLLAAFYIFNDDILIYKKIFIFFI